MIKLQVNGQEISVASGTTVAAALIAAGVTDFRTSITGSPRGPLCGMGICFECRVIINGASHQRSCIKLAEDGMEVVTGE